MESKHNPGEFVSEVRLVGLKSALMCPARLPHLMGALKVYGRGNECTASDFLARSLPLPAAFKWVVGWHSEQFVEFAIVKWGVAAWTNVTHCLFRVGD